MVEKSNIPRICDVSFQKAKVARPTKSAQVLTNHFVHIHLQKTAISLCVCPRFGSMWSKVHFSTSRIKHI